MVVNCEVKSDPIKRSSGAAGFIERFEIVRDKEKGLFIFGHSNESVQRAGEASFIVTTKTKYPHHQTAELIKGRNWED